MDLRSIINNEAGDGSSSSAQQTAPVTPLQAPPQQVFREYSHPSHASPAQRPSQDYGSQSQQPGGSGPPYASPKTFQAAYPGRPPPPPPIQAPPQPDLRSPARSYSTAQSPYRTPSSTMSSAQYPFPHSNQTPQSPAQSSQYPQQYQQRERERERESYPSNPPPLPQHQSSHNQPSPAPRTPPIGMPGAPHPYLQHQRSHSSVSSSTPTSAQSQPPYFNQYPQESPIAAPSHIQSNQIPQHHRQQSLQSNQQSQPGTPLGPPISQRQSSGGYPQPSSPYQQRGQSIGPFPQYQQSPQAPSPAAIPRVSSTSSAYDSQRPSVASISEQHRRSQSERERSLSVSPKTRLPSQPPVHHPPPQPENTYNLAKRKMDDRDIPIDAPRRVDQQDIQPMVNGSHRVSHAPTASPTPPPKKRIRYTEPPIWAQSIRNKNIVKGFGKSNGGLGLAASPMAKVETNGNRHASPTISRDVQSDVVDPHPSLLLGPWETSITGIKPTQALTGQVADFIFSHVVARPDLGELASRGVHIEIEAKLGKIVSMDTNERFNIPVTTECVITEGYKMLSFRSEMTDHQHQALNTLLNAQVADAHPQNHARSKRRVEIQYIHSRETDKFYELPPEVLRDIIPAAIQQYRGRHAPKLRVTFDQKTNQIKAKIIKFRVADLNIFMPRQPLDCRISINFEMEIKGPVDDLIAQSAGIQQPDRNKDRLSYTHGLYQVDLTQVTTTKSHNGVNMLDKEHELEIELSTAAVREQGTRAKTGQPNEYLALIEGLMDNIRVLSRAVPP